MPWSANGVQWFADVNTPVCAHRSHRTISVRHSMSKIDRIVPAADGCSQRVRFVSHNQQHGSITQWRAVEPTLARCAPRVGGALPEVPGELSSTVRTLFVGCAAISRHLRHRTGWGCQQFLCSSLILGPYNKRTECLSTTEGWHVAGIARCPRNAHEVKTPQPSTSVSGAVFTPSRLYYSLRINATRFRSVPTGLITDASPTAARHVATAAVRATNHLQYHP